MHPPVPKGGNPRRSRHRHRRRLRGQRHRLAGPSPPVRPRSAGMMRMIVAVFVVAAISVSVRAAPVADKPADKPAAKPSSAKPADKAAAAARSLEALLRQAEDALAAEDYKAARDAFSDVLTVEPANSRAL